MRHLTERPTHAYLLHTLPSDDQPPRYLERLPLEDLEVGFTEYEDTGWEPRLEWLYGTLRCACIDTRSLPGFGRLWLDDEALLREGPVVNPIASMLYSAYYEAGAAGHPICGLVLLTVDHTLAEDGDADTFVASRLQDAVVAFGRNAARNYSGTLATAEALEKARQFHKAGEYHRASGYFAIAASRAVHPATEEAAKKGAVSSAANFVETVLAGIDW